MPNILGTTTSNLPQLLREFRPLLKRYAQFQIASDRTAGTIDQQMLHLGRFFTFFEQRYPALSTLHDLIKEDVDAFINYLKVTINVRGRPISEVQVGYHVENLEGLLCYLERSQSAIRPEKPIACHHLARPPPILEDNKRI